MTEGRSKFHICTVLSCKRSRMEDKMDEQMKRWLDEEMKEYADALKEFSQKQTRMVYLWMGCSVVGMVALGFAVGGDAASVFRMHFPIGCVIALFVWFCFWVQNKFSSIKKVRAAYERSIAAFFQKEEDRNTFLRQMESGNYGKLHFLNTAMDKYPCRFIAGPDYFMFVRSLSCSFIRVADIDDIYAEEEKSRVRYRMGDYRIMQNITMGISLVIEYKPDAVSKKGEERDKIYLENGKQFDQVVELIRKYCPDSKKFMADL